MVGPHSHSMASHRVPPPPQAAASFPTTQISLFSVSSPWSPWLSLAGGVAVDQWVWQKINKTISPNKNYKFCYSPTTTSLSPATFASPWVSMGFRVFFFFFGRKLFFFLFFFFLFLRKTFNSNSGYWFQSLKSDTEVDFEVLDLENISIAFTSGWLWKLWDSKKREKTERKREEIKKKRVKNDILMK